MDPARRTEDFVQRGLTSETIGSDSAAQPWIDELDLLTAQTGSQGNPLVASKDCCNCALGAVRATA